MLKRRCCRREEVKGAKITNLLWKYSATQANCTHCQDAGNCMRVRSREYSYEYTLLSGYRVVSPRWKPNLTKLTSDLAKKVVQKDTLPVRFKFYLFMWTLMCMPIPVFISFPKLLNEYLYGLVLRAVHKNRWANRIFLRIGPLQHTTCTVHKSSLTEIMNTGLWHREEYNVLHDVKRCHWDVRFAEQRETRLWCSGMWQRVLILYVVTSFSE
jgi:hypothetical protein